MSVARNTLVQSSLTLASRVLGMVRDILLVARIGAGPIGDAWATAQQFPNLFRRVFAEGAFASAFVPTYARTLEAEGADAARVVAQEACNCSAKALVRLCFFCARVPERNSSQPSWPMISAFVTSNCSLP